VRPVTANKRHFGLESHQQKSGVRSSDRLAKREGMEMNKKMLQAGVTVLVVILSVCVSLAQPKSIKLGWTGPLTGPAAESGVALKQGAMLALEEWNVKGGIQVAEYNKRIPVEILFEDCQSKPEIGVSLAEKLITRDKVHVLMSDAFHSSITMAVMELAPKYKIPIVSGGVSEEISKKVLKDPSRYKFFWKMIHGASAEARGIFYAYKELTDKKLFTPKTKTVAFIVEDSDFGRSHAAILKDMFEKDGWKVVALETVPMGHTDLYPQLNKLKSLSPEILVTSFASLPSGAALVKQFHEVGLKSSLSAIYYPMLPEFLPQVGKSAENLLWLPLQIDETIPKHKEFLEKMASRFKVQGNINNAQMYEMINYTFDCIERAGSLDPEKVVDAISKLDRKGLLGRAVFDQNKHEIRDGLDYIPLPVAQITGGRSSIVVPTSIATQKYVHPPWMK
jgi:branched-chain amino acid transport system substrate-binding protein